MSTVYQSVLTAVGSFSVPDMVGLSVYQSFLNACRLLRQFSETVSETDCLTVYQSVLTAVRQFSVAETDDLNVYESILTALRHFSVAETVGVNVYPSVLTAGRQRQFSVPEMDGPAPLSVKVS